TPHGLSIFSPKTSKWLPSFPISATLPVNPTAIQGFPTFTPKANIDSPSRTRFIILATVGTVLGVALFVGIVVGVRYGLVRRRNRKEELGREHALEEENRRSRFEGMERRFWEGRGNADEKRLELGDVGGGLGLGSAEGVEEDPYVPHAVTMHQKYLPGLPAPPPPSSGLDLGSGVMTAVPSGLHYDASPSLSPKPSGESLASSVRPTSDSSETESDIETTTSHGTSSGMSSSASRTRSSSFVRPFATITKRDSSNSLTGSDHGTGDESDLGMKKVPSQASSRNGNRRSVVSLMSLVEEAASSNGGASSRSKKRKSKLAEGEVPWEMPGMGIQKGMGQRKRPVSGQFSGVPGLGGVAVGPAGAGGSPSLQLPGLIPPQHQQMPFYYPYMMPPPPGMVLAPPPPPGMVPPGMMVPAEDAAMRKRSMSQSSKQSESTSTAAESVASVPASTAVSPTTTTAAPFYYYYPPYLPPSSTAPTLSSNSNPSASNPSASNPSASNQSSTASASSTTSDDTIPAIQPRPPLIQIQPTTIDRSSSQPGKDLEQQWHQWWMANQQVYMRHVQQGYDPAGAAGGDGKEDEAQKQWVAYYGAWQQQQQQYVATTVAAAQPVTTQALENPKSPTSPTFAGSAYLSKKPSALSLPPLNRETPDEEEEEEGEGEEVVVVDGDGEEAKDGGEAEEALKAADEGDAGDVKEQEGVV
ncbi:hypothetical protein HDU97_009478, partial [Phlyctochytrium planicorne]